MQTECLDYRQLPGLNPLFPEYLYQYDRLESLYSSPVHLSLDALKERAESVLKNPPPYPRDQLVELTTAFNQRVGAGEKVFQNLEKLRSPRTLAVVTGQQPGFFGGPALTVYKALTAVRLAQMLDEEGYPAVPVFWLASDDTDFHEVCLTSFFADNGDLFSVRYQGPQQNGSRMVGTIPLNTVEECFSRLQKEGPKGEFHEEVLQLLQETYPPSKSFREAAGSWLSHLFRPYGLILFDALLPEYKQGVGSLFARAIEKRREILQALKGRAEALQERGFDPQVRVQDSESFIFWTEGENRYKLEYGGERYRRKAQDSPKLSEQELLRELDQQAEKFAPNVLLRPIVQDHLFPTVAYVGGPSEVAYFAQVSAISRFWNKEMAVFPRVGITLVDRKAQRLLRKYGLKVLDVLQLTPQELSRRIVEGKDPEHILERLEHVQKELQSELRALKDDIGKIDPTVAEMVGGAEKKILYQIEKIQKRFVANHRNQEATFGQHLDYLCSHLYPHGKLQERVMSFNQFLSEEGPDLVDRLLNVIDPFCPSHQVIYL
ncbi:MAG: bacillithiol biosynthesis cysteine-adding enzyme BshC [Acidobacteriota bacterium]